jgi:hypothetical protein
MCNPTLWVVFIRILQVGLNFLPSYHLLNLLLRIWIEWVLVEQCHLILPLALLLVSVVQHAHPQVSEAAWVVYCGGELWLLLDQARHLLGIGEYLCPNLLDPLRRQVFRVA